MTDIQQKLFNEYLSHALSIARKYHNSSGLDCDELEQCARLALADAARTYNEQSGSFRAYSAICVSNKLKDYFRAEKTRAFRNISDEIFLNELADEEPDPSREAAREDIRAALNEGLAKLTAKQRAAFEKIVLDGKKMTEIAASDGTTPESVQNLRDRAIVNMRSHLGECGIAGTHFMPDIGNSTQSVPNSPKPIQKIETFRSSFAIKTFFALLLLLACVLLVAGMLRRF